MAFFYIPNVDITIEKKSSNSLLSDDNIKHLKTKLSELNQIYNIILKNLCIKKTSSNYDILNNIKKELSKIEPLCLGSTALGKCDNMFNDDRLEKLINAMLNDRFLNKVCRYKITYGLIEPFNLPANVKVGGGSDVVKQLDIFSFMQDSRETTCVGMNGIYKCYSHKNCEYCSKWEEERKTFKNVVNEMLNSNNLDLMTDSIHLLPSVMLDKNHYNQFHTLYNQFKNKSSIHVKL